MSWKKIWFCLSVWRTKSEVKNLLSQFNVHKASSALPQNITEQIIHAHIPPCLDYSYYNSHVKATPQYHKLFQNQAAKLNTY